MGMLNYYPTTPSPDQRVMFVSPIRFILDGKYYRFNDDLNQRKCFWDLKGRYTIFYCLISFRAGASHYRIFPDFLKSPVSKWRIVRIKTRTKAFFFEEILINIPLENLPRLSKERMQYFFHALKLDLKSRHSASASNCSMNRSARTKGDYNFSTAKDPLFNSIRIC